MIRTYTINELEELTGVSKRTISDYITKGLLLGPSHRGRGAVYSQHDFYALRVIPKLRSLFKDEYGSLKAIASFLRKLSLPDLQLLAARRLEHAFTVEVRRLRLRADLMSLFPHISPEKFDDILHGLTPEQIRRVDAGQMQMGTIIDLQTLFAAEEQLALTGESLDGEPTDPQEYSSLEDTLEDTDELPQLREALPVSDDDDPEEVLPGNTRSNGRKLGKQDSRRSEADKLISTKLDEIGDRLNRVEQMLEYDN